MNIQYNTKINFETLEISREITRSAIEITNTMLLTLVLAQKNATFEQFAKKHIISNINKLIKNNDPQTQEIFKNLFAATENQVEKLAIPLLKVFEVINVQNPSNQALFIASFVYPVAHELRAHY